MTKAITVSFITVAAIAGITAFEESRISALQRELDLQRTSGQDLQSKLASAISDSDDLRGKIDVFKSESEELRKKLAQASASPAPSVATAPQQPADAKGEVWMKAVAKMFSDPEMKKSMRSQQLVGIRMMYGDLGKKLGLSPQDSEQLMELLADRQMDQTAKSLKAMDGSDPNKSDDATKSADPGARYDDQIKAMLGDEKYKQLQGYERSMGDRLLLRQFEGQFGAAGAPLQGDQKEKLLSLMSEERAQMPEQYNLTSRANQMRQIDSLKQEGFVDEYVTKQQEFQSRVLERSREFLNADQIGAFQKVQQQQLDLIKMQLKMSREMMGAGK